MRLLRRRHEQPETVDDRREEWAEVLRRHRSRPSPALKREQWRREVHERQAMVKALSTAAPPAKRLSRDSSAGCPGTSSIPSPPPTIVPTSDPDPGVPELDALLPDAPEPGLSDRRFVG
jgi:hypothetical protein